MKRDMDVIRQILLALDSNETTLPLREIEGIEPEVFKY